MEIRATSAFTVTGWSHRERTWAFCLFILMLFWPREAVCGEGCAGKGETAGRKGWHFYCENKSGDTSEPAKSSHKMSEVELRALVSRHVNGDHSIPLASLSPDDRAAFLVHLETLKAKPSPALASGLSGSGSPDLEARARAEADDLIASLKKRFEQSDTGGAKGGFFSVEASE